MQPKNSTFNDRQAASLAAKKALLEKFKPKPAVKAEAPIDHEAERLARLESVRLQRQEEKEAKQRAREDAAAAAEQARLEALAAAERAKQEAEHLSDAQKRAERKARKKEVKEQAKAKKEMKTVSKPSGGGPREERVLDPIEEHRRYIASLERGRERRRA
jgi:regulator of protease activity HflC (stomatin/prohibitin superfamily)